MLILGRWFFAGACIVLFLMFHAPSQAQPKQALLPLSRALNIEAKIAGKSASPLVVMVSLEGCVYCKIVREQYLYPLFKQDKIHVVQVDMNSTQALINFEGKLITHGEQVRRWRVKVAPTVYFFNANGRQVAQPLEGGYLPDFYASYLSSRLQEAQNNILNAAQVD